MMAAEADMIARLAALTEAFQAVDKEMRGLPVYNSMLSVEAVGFREHGEYLIGVLITPWFMGLVALSPDGQAWQDLDLGDRQVWDFPSGSYEFMVGEVGEDGRVPLRYQSLSLFSPTGEFDGQEEARLAADGALTALFMPAEEIDRLAAKARTAERDTLPPEIARRNREAGR
jgi:[NiFe] hydrogenase assembly HybE family chaperone